MSLRFTISFIFLAYLFHYQYIQYHATNFVFQIRNTSFANTIMKNEQLPEAIFVFSEPDILDLFSAVSDQFVNIEHGIYNILCFKDRFFNIEKL